MKKLFKSAKPSGHAHQAASKLSRDMTALSNHLLNK